MAYFSPTFKLHKPRYRHPEAPDRLDYFMDGLREAGLEAVEPVMREDVWALIEMAHDRSYIEYVKRLCGVEYAEIDGDTYVSRGTCDAAALAVSAIATAIDRREPSIVAARPPGHHAGFVGRALTAPTQGFCIFNTAAIGALYVGNGAAVVDIDVHHGNGTQEVLYEREILYISTHQHPHTIYPGTGFPDEVGMGRGEGYNVNIPLPPMLGDDLYRRAIDEVVMPILRQYGPKVVIVSLGWDAHRDDPLANMNLTLGSYLHVFKSLLALQRPVVFTLEGGYNREVLRRGARVLASLLRGEHVEIEQPTETDRRGQTLFEKELREVKNSLSKYWRL
ncbi:MAG: histone deacetylase family protein [Pyrobaculum sp.]